MFFLFFTVNLEELRAAVRDRAKPNQSLEAVLKITVKPPHRVAYCVCRITLFRRYSLAVRSMTELT